MIKNLFGILVTVSVNVIKRMILVCEYLDYEHFKCRKKLVDNIVDECTETIQEVKLAEITLTENENSYKRSSCAVYIVLMIVAFTIFTGITTYFDYYN